MPDAPAYLRIAADLRTAILSGTLAPGSKLPTESALMERYAVSRTVAKYAINVLKGDGLVEGRRGSGVYVRTIRRLTRFGHGRDQRAASGSTSPFARDSSAAGHAPSWRHTSERGQADEDTARRLRIEVGAPVMSTRYTFLADGEPIQLSWSREPLAITGGSDVELPEDGAAVGVVARMDRIGIRITESEERVTARPAALFEVDELRLPPRSFVFVIHRTYLAGEVPVETADIVIPLDRYELVYRLPID